MEKEEGKTLKELVDNDYISCGAFSPVFANVIGNRLVIYSFDREKELFGKIRDEVFDDADSLREYLLDFLS